MERGGWARPLSDDEAMTFVDEVQQRADAFLFGRRTYELFAGREANCRCTAAATWSAGSSTTSWSDREPS